MSTTPKHIAAKTARLAIQSCKELQAMKSPRESYQDKVNEVNAEINRSWQHLSMTRMKNDQRSQLKLQQKIVKLGRVLESLTINFKATSADEQRVYEERQQEVIRCLQHSLQPILWADQNGNPLHIPGSASYVEVPNETLGSSYVSMETPGGNGLTPMQDDNTPSLPAIQESLEAGHAIPICISDTEENENNDEHGEDGEHEGDAEDRDATKKRNRNDAEAPGLVEPRKRRRQVEKQVSIAYNEIWQGGKIPNKQIIVEFPKGSKKWYILRCNEHNLDFRENPIQGAAMHLAASKHGQMPRTFETAIKYLGIQVKGCTKAKADKNNATVRAALSSETVNNTKGTHTRLTRANRAHIALNRIDDNVSHSDDIIIDPTPGKVYLGFWRKSKDWLPLLILPTHNFDRNIGISSTLEELGLLNDLPACYIRKKGSQKLQWAKNFQDGGTLTSKREFPVIYFDGLRFPEKSAVGWVAATDLQEFNPDKASSLIPHIKQVLDFLKQRQKKSPYSFSSNDSIQPEDSNNTNSYGVHQASLSPATASETLSHSIFIPSDPSEGSFIDLDGEMAEYTAGAENLNGQVSTLHQTRTPSLITYEDFRLNGDHTIADLLSYSPFPTDDSLWNSAQSTDLFGGDPSSMALVPDSTEGPIHSTAQAQDIHDHTGESSGLQDISLRQIWSSLRLQEDELN